MDCFNFQSFQVLDDFDSFRTDSETSSVSKSFNFSSSPPENGRHNRKSLENQLFQESYESEISHSQIPIQDEWLSLPHSNFQVQLDSPPRQSGSLQIRSPPQDLQMGRQQFSDRSSRFPVDFIDGSEFAQNYKNTNFGDYSNNNSSPRGHDQFEMNRSGNNLLAHVQQPVRHQREYPEQAGRHSSPPVSVDHFNMDSQNQAFHHSPHYAPQQQQQQYQPQPQQQRVMGPRFIDRKKPEPPRHEGSDLVYVVAFKTVSKDYILGVRVPAVIGVGDAVIVSVERGEDLGFVTRVMTMGEFMMERFQTAFLPQQFNINRYVGCILRAATPREVRMLSMKTNDEQEVLEYARHLARNVYHIPFDIHNVEYQFDRHKLTIHYDAKTRVEYKNFVNDLFNTFKSRIWMERIGGNNNI